jgi:hypothetical protein
VRKSFSILEREEAFEEEEKRLIIAAFARGILVASISVQAGSVPDALRLKHRKGA